MGIANPNPQRMAVKRQPMKGSSKLIVNYDCVDELVIRVMIGANQAPASARMAMIGKTT